MIPDLVFRTTIPKTPAQKGDSLLQFSEVVLLTELLLELVRSFLLSFFPALLNLLILHGPQMKV